MKYTVLARRWEHGWELHIDGVGVTQSHGLADADEMARDYIAAVKVLPPHSFDIEITPEIEPNVDEKIRKVAVEARALDSRRRELGRETRGVVKELRRAGLTGRDTAAVLGLSPQRVSQLMKEDLNA